MENELKKLILSRSFEEAAKLTENLTQKKLEDIVFNITNDIEDISCYLFVCHLLNKNESIDMHIMASVLMSHYLVFEENAYAIALQHVRQALCLEPTNIDLMEMVLFFSITPDQLVSKEEATQFAKRIIEIDPNNETVLTFYKKYIEN